MTERRLRGCEGVADADASSEEMPRAFPGPGLCSSGGVVLVACHRQGAHFLFSAAQSGEIACQAVISNFLIELIAS